MHFSCRLFAEVAFIFTAAATAATATATAPALPLAAHASAATLIPDNAIGARVDSSNETEVMSTLKSLVGHQTRGEIEALATSGKPVELYVDASSGKILSAVASTAAPVQSSGALGAVKPLGPGV